MKNTIGNNVAITIFGESHGECIGCVIDGLPSGIKIDLNFLNDQLAKRRPEGKISTSRIEKDEYRMVSGYFNGYTTGTPLTIIFPNTSQHSADYDALKNLARPGHADYSGNCKYHGYQDYRGGGHFSGRVTVAIVAAGAICLQMLKEKNIQLGTHILRLKDIEEPSFSNNVEKEIATVNQKYFPSLINEEKMKEAIKQVRNNNDSIGGILETAVIGLESGIGEPYFDSLESIISHYLFSVGGVKGIEFGAGFEFASMSGKQANDEYRYVNNEVVTLTNNNGGINGGISNGMPIIIKTVVKATPSIAQKQQTIDFINKTNQDITISGRHDPAIIHRARVVVDSLVALAIVDLLVERHGINWWNNLED